MDIKGKKIGIALTGSFCTFEKMFTELQNLKEAGADIYPIMSDASQTIESRFGTPDTYVKIGRASCRERVSAGV